MAWRHKSPDPSARPLHAAWPASAQARTWCSGSARNIASRSVLRVFFANSSARSHCRKLTENVSGTEVLEIHKSTGRAGPIRACGRPERGRAGWQQRHGRLRWTTRPTSEVRGRRCSELRVRPLLGTTGNLEGCSSNAASDAARSTSRRERCDERSVKGCQKQPVPQLGFSSEECIASPTATTVTHQGQELTCWRTPPSLLCSSPSRDSFSLPSF